MLKAVLIRSRDHKLRLVLERKSDIIWGTRMTYNRIGPDCVDILRVNDKGCMLS